MATLNKSHRKKLNIIDDTLEFYHPLDDIDAVIRKARQLIGNWCSYDCYYYDCGEPCPDDSPCLLELCQTEEELQSEMNKVESSYTEEDWSEIYPSNVF